MIQPNVNPCADEDGADFQDYERRQRQIEADKVLADRIQRQELSQRQRHPNSQESQDRLTQTDEELAVCLLANYLHQRDGSTSQSEPEQTFSGAASSSSDVTDRAKLDEVIAHSLSQSVHPQCKSTTSSNNDADSAGDQQALEEALCLSLLESQQHVHDDVSHQQALDEAIALSLSTAQGSGQTLGDNTSENEYENLLEIEELLGSVAAMSLSPSQLHLLPTHKYKERTLNHQGPLERREMCAICLVMYEAGSDVKLLPCLHTFHVECIDEWLQRKAVCPTCNIPVEFHDSSEIYSG